MRRRLDSEALDAVGYLVGENGALERNAEGGYIKIDRDLLEQMRSERWEPDKNLQRSHFPPVESFSLETC